MQQQQQAHEGRLADVESRDSKEFDRWKTTQDNDTKVKIAEIGADGKTEAALSKGEDSGRRDGEKPKRQSAIDKLGEMHSSQMDAMMQAIGQIGQMVAQLAQMMEHQTRPTNIEITRPDGTKLRAVAQKGTH